MLELIEREQLPNDVRTTLAGALSGDMRRQQLLFQAMIDTWPRLQKALGEVKRAARKAPWRVLAWASRGQKPKSSAEALARDVENDIWMMRPDPKCGEKGFEGTVEELVMGYYLGHQVLEIHWDKGSDGWKPRSTKVVPPRFFNYPYDTLGEDRLMLDPTGGMTMNLVDFPEHKFLVAVNGGHPGHAAIAAPLRALTGYWLAAVYGLKWLMQFAQICGVPIRWAEYGSDPDKKKVAEMLQNIGTAGWGAFPAGTKLNFVETNKSAQNVPQKVLLDVADEQCDIFILGQTLTSSAGDKGTQALGTVHAGVRQDVIAGVCDFVGEVLSYQLAPSIVAVNYGTTRNDIPGVWVEWPETRDDKALAERDVALGITSGKTPVGRAWFYERHGIPLPADGEEIFQPTAGSGDGNTPNCDPSKPGDPDGDDDEGDPDGGNGNDGGGKKPVASADASDWQPLPDSLGIPRAEMPQIKSGDRSAMVQFMRSRGIESRQEEVSASALRPTQAEFSPAKVEMAKNYSGGNRAILVSEEYRVVDGHHQWMAAKEAGESIRVIRLMAPIHRVLMMALRMPSTKVAAADASIGASLDEDAIAMLLAKAWVDGAKKSNENP